MAVRAVGRACPLHQVSYNYGHIGGERGEEHAATAHVDHLGD